VATKPTNWKNLAQVIQYAEQLARETSVQRTVYCINGQPHYAVCEKGKIPQDFVKIGKLIVRKDYQQRYNSVFTTNVTM
jgi:hypothetical protein